MSSVQENLDQYLSKLVELNRFSGCVLVGHNRQVLFEKAYGYSNHEEQTPNQLDTVFKIGSLSKQFTAFAVLCLVEKGFLALNDTLDKFIKGFPLGDKITIQHLLDHTSGLPAEGELGDGSDSSLRKIIMSNQSLYPASTPGETYQYSNLGYTLLAHLIEILSGWPFGVYLREAIFIPLELYHTAHYTHQQLLNKMAYGYSFSKGDFSYDEHLGVGHLYGAGSLYSNIKDLYRWSEALLGKTCYKTELFKKMLSIPAETSYSFGLEQENFNGRRLFSHMGLIHSFRSGFFLYPEEDYTVLFLGNMKPLPLLKLKEDLSAIVFGENYQMPEAIKRKSIEFPEKNLGLFTGLYQLESDPTQRVEITLLNGQLMQHSGEDKTPLYPESQNTFFVHEDSEETLTFQQENSKIIGLEYLTSDGWTAKLSKLK